MTLADRVYRNPYLYSSTVVARSSVCVATLIWSFVVLLLPNATGSNPNYRHMLDLLPNENVWAFALLAISLPMLVRLFACSPPRKIGALFYAALTLFWSFLWWGIVISPQVWPTGMAASTVVMGLSIYAFVANPREYCTDCRMDDGVCLITKKPCKNARGAIH